MPVGFWRSVGYSSNAFFHECFLDELAHAAGLDPLEMRLGLLAAEHATSARVLETVAEMAGWGGALSPDRAQGVAFCFSYGTPVAQMVQVRRRGDGIAVEKVWCAEDVGLAINPRNIEAQIQSGVIFGLSAAILGEVTFTGGAATRRTSTATRCCGCARRRRSRPGSCSPATASAASREPATPPAAPALANAVFALTGERIRPLPLSRSVRFA